MSWLLFFLALAATGLASCSRQVEPAVESGVSLRLARQRADRISNLRYQLDFSIPEAPKAPIGGSETVEFDLEDASRPLVLDFRPGGDHLKWVKNERGRVDAAVASGHLVIPPGALQPGHNRLEIAFQAGDGPLNRRPGYLYTLFVPDRASEAFPCFDQPDLKARFRLRLRIPAAWRAVANAPLASQSRKGRQRELLFQETRPLPTYLFAFAAGRFQVEEARRQGRRFRMFHRETDARRVKRNRDAIFDLEAAALHWMEQYTGLPYPFAKFDFVLIPAFQFGGMEHPGAVLYSASRLLLGETPTQQERLARASVIAHETAHMWFGDLVTMRWFDDVWMKEVFANFMAAKIVNPSFPSINHELRFFLGHYPAAYSVDRTAGTHPIRQALENLSRAAELYGDIIYHKAPIVMRKLEDLVGSGAFRRGMREYLGRYRYGNAGWPELVDILDRLTPEDIAAWSRRWVEERGRPILSVEVRRRGDGLVSRVLIHQRDPLGGRRSWRQRLEVTLVAGGRRARLPLSISELQAEVLVPPQLGRLQAVLLNAAGRGYDLFEPDRATLGFLLERLPRLQGDLLRAVGWVTLYEEMLEGRVRPEQLLALARRMLGREKNELLLGRVLGDLETIYWRFLGDSRRRQGEGLEQLLWERLLRSRSSSLEAALFRTWMSLLESREGREKLRAIWEGSVRVGRLHFEESDFIRMAEALALRDGPHARAILARQVERTRNPERRARLEFVAPALSPDPAERRHFFQELSLPERRQRERWVLEGLAWLHHPLRARQSIPLIRPALDLLIEIRDTGDIFFPRRWLDATLGGHRSPEAARIVRRFLEEHPHYPPRLRAKILQAADLLFRAAKLSTPTTPDHTGV